MYADNTTDRIVATIRLYEDGVWIKSWRDTAYGNLDFSETVAAESGSTYELVAYATIAGVELPAVSDEGTCP